MLWSTLLQDDPVRLELELAKAGTTLNDLARDIRDVPELGELTARMSRDARKLLALEYFGDQGHPQPVDRRAWVRRTSGSRSSSRSQAVTRKTPDFGRLPPLSILPPGADTSAASEPARRGPGRSGKEYPGAGVEEVVRRAHAATMNGEHLGHTLRDKISADAGVTRHEVELIFKAIRAGKLEYVSNEGRLRIDGQLAATPSFINLHALLNRS